MSKTESHICSPLFPHHLLLLLLLLAPLPPTSLHDQRTEQAVRPRMRCAGTDGACTLCASRCPAASSLRTHTITRSHTNGLLLIRPGGINRKDSVRVERNCGVIVISDPTRQSLLSSPLLSSLLSSHPVGLAGRPGWPNKTFSRRSLQTGPGLTTDRRTTSSNTHTHTHTNGQRVGEWAGGTGTWKKA
ncbi:unnamed protein product [Protopolystoma xenopodis]|uniref:C2H2-type domain-containing protein n=1 Tax=Protopolystoma xenopodis TaxID=117903 RepID=A0A3S5CR88_9PLAT|nr:unnamed protein product [Protopolystoma xenopodis]